MNPRRESSGSRKNVNAPVVRANLRVVSRVSWADVPDDTVSSLVSLVTKNGAAIMFGVTSDGGALSLCILDNQNKVKEYPRDETEVYHILTWLRDEYFADGGKPAA